MLNGETSDIFPLRKGTRERSLLLPLLFNIIMFLASAIRQET